MQSIFQSVFPILMQAYYILFLHESQTNTKKVVINMEEVTPCKIDTLSYVKLIMARRDVYERVYS